MQEGSPVSLPFLLHEKVELAFLGSHLGDVKGAIPEIG
jgi:hypothetical protein